jgi:NAD-dependent DNA ligase
VLSGSANLTGAGLGDNVEQFEEFVLKSTEGRAHRARFQTLWEMGTSMTDARSAWARYKEVYARIARSRQRHEEAATAFTADVARRRKRPRAKRLPQPPPNIGGPGHPYAPRGYGSLRASEARTATEFQRKFPSLKGVRVGTTGAFDGTTQAAVHAALKAKHAEVRNDNRVQGLHVLIIGKRPGENKLKQARLEKAFLLPFEEARKLTFLKRLA